RVAQHRHRAAADQQRGKQDPSEYRAESLHEYPPSPAAVPGRSDSSDAVAGHAGERHDRPLRVHADAGGKRARVANVDVLAIAQAEIAVEDAIRAVLARHSI